MCDSVNQASASGRHAPSPSSSIRAPVGFGAAALMTAQNLTPAFSLSPLITLFLPLFAHMRSRFQPPSEENTDLPFLHWRLFRFPEQ